MIAFCKGRLRHFAWAAFAGLLAFGPIAAQAHPHVFIKQHVEAVFDRSGLTGIRLTWRFDAMYSSMMRADYVSSKKGPLTPEDVKTLHDKCFSALKDEHYFTTVTFDGHPLPLGVPTDFSAEAAGDSIVYRFVIPLKLLPGQIRPTNKVEISVFDPSYYVYYELAAGKPVDVVGGSEFGAACTAKAVWRPSIGWGTVHSDLVTCTYRGPRS
jgi:ABC-type uncharacterized transport system substrate-binding protein